MAKRFVLNMMVTLGLLTAAFDHVSAADRLERYEFLQIEMGVPFRIVLYAANQSVANKAAMAAYARIKQLNGVMSDYDPDSELMQLCQSSPPGKPVKVSHDLERVISHALRLSRRTNGAFDVTIGPVVKLWRIARRKKQLPPPAALAAARQQVGYQHIQLNSKQYTIELQRAQMRLDLGGIAKGFAADEALKVLKSHGITRALIDGSGDIVVGEPPPQKVSRDAKSLRSGARPAKGWIIEIAPPQKEGEAKAKPIRLQLANTAVATSGDAYQYIEIDGKRFSHIINPQTGLGLTQSSSVTIIAENGMTADSLASAVSVMGPLKGLKLVEQCKSRAAMVVLQDSDDRQERYQSESFAKFIAITE